MTYKKGDRVQYNAGGGWKPIGTIKRTAAPVVVEGQVVTEESYTVVWDTTLEESGWIPVSNLVPA